MSNSQLKQYDEKMSKTIEKLEDDFNAIRAGRANPHILDKITVDYYGQPTPLQQVGNITVPEATLLQIQPWDTSILKQIEKALLASDVGITPTNDGKVIRLAFPELTEQRRKELTKEIKKLGENAKVSIRNIRRDALDIFKKKKKDNEITEDDLADIEKDVQKITDEYVSKIEKHVELKNKDIMSL